MLRTILILAFVLTVPSLVSAQATQSERGPLKKMPGVVKGEILIKEIGGNNLGKFGCSNIVVGINRIDAKRPYDWKRGGTATGDISTKQCSFSVPNVPAYGTFVAVISAKFPNGCDQKIFNATTSFPMQLKKGGEVLVYNFAVSKISCVMVK